METTLDGWFFRVVASPMALVDVLDVPSRKGYLAPSYRSVAKKAYQGLLEQFVLVHADGRISVTQQCLGFGRGKAWAAHLSTHVFAHAPPAS